MAASVGTIRGARLSKEPRVSARKQAQAAAVVAVDVATLHNQFAQRVAQELNALNSQMSSGLLNDRLNHEAVLITIENMLNVLVERIAAHDPKPRTWKEKLLRPFRWRKFSHSYELRKVFRRIRSERYDYHMGRAAADSIAAGLSVLAPRVHPTAEVSTAS